MHTHRHNRTGTMYEQKITHSDHQVGSAPQYNVECTENVDKEVSTVIENYYALQITIAHNTTKSLSPKVKSVRKVTTYQIQGMYMFTP